MLKRFKYESCLVAIVFLAVSTHAAMAQEITVMTRNLYLGADLAPVIAAATEADFLLAAQTALAQVAANNFPERAQALAAEIVEKKPHLVGLQEVYNFTLNGNNGTAPFRNHLTDLMNTLTEQGADYKVAATVNNINILIPLGANLLGVTDSDVILARGDVFTSVVPVTQSGCQPSADGCNYTVVATPVTPLGTIPIERGFVAVDAQVGEDHIRFVNTHLELRYPDPTNSLSPSIQSAQATELILILAGLANSNSAKIIVVGDINSSPKDETITVENFAMVPPYSQFTSAGYNDTWLLRPGKPPGFTCCQAEDLMNRKSALNERIDVTFSLEPPSGRVRANLVGNEETDKTPSGLWPSDHAGVVTRLEFAP